MKEASAIILAAGAGTRMRSAIPKVAHRLLGKPLVNYVIDAARAAGVGRFVVVVGHGREQVEPLLPEDCELVSQMEQLGTGHAVGCCRGAFELAEGFREGSVLVLSGDCPLIKADVLAELIELREAHQAACVALTMDLEDPSGYGRIVRDADGDLAAIVEDKDASVSQRQIRECNAGFYCFDGPSLFKALDQVSSDNAQGEYYLTDVIEICRASGQRVLAHKTSDPDCCRGVNSRAQLAEASRLLQRSINEGHMANGVTMTDPGLVWIGPDVEIEQDVELLPMTFLWGATQVASGTLIGPNSRLTDTTVGHDCVIDECVCIESFIGDGCNCGPRAYLRPGTRLLEGVKAGTHVEIKNSTIRAKAKVPHLSYIGDADLGEGVNIGAGSITCNYDGEKKWPTRVGKDSFIGSDTMLVAPVTLGERVTTGAGSVITDDVPDDALALGRARQVEIPDWTARKAQRKAQGKS